MKVPVILSEITAWIEGENVGKFMVMRSHKGGVGVGTEECVKMHELEPDIAAIINGLVSHFGALRVNIICNVHNGLADRIELFRYRG